MSAAERTALFTGYASLIFLITLTAGLYLFPDKGLIPLEGSDHIYDIKMHRGFSDDFTRSPGSGLGRWKELAGSWDINFTFDPNRIPFQYALMCTSEGKGMIEIDEPDWRGCVFRCSVYPVKDSEFGFFFDRGKDGEFLEVLFSPENSLSVLGSGIHENTRIKGLDQKQWNRIEIRRWGWSLHVKVNNVSVYSSDSLAHTEGRIGLISSKEGVLFDDILAEEIPWLADNGKDLNISWQTRKGSGWFRSREQLFALKRNTGSVSLQVQGMEPSLLFAERTDGRIVSSDWKVTGKSLCTLTLAGEKECEYSRLAVAFVPEMDRTKSFGPYTFENNNVEDPSDFLDFTEKEYEFIRNSDENDLLRRNPKFIPVLSRKAEKTIWRIRSGKWSIQDSVLLGAGKNAAVQHVQEIMGPFSVQFRIRFLNSSAEAEWRFYSDKEGNVPVVLSSVSEKKPGEKVSLHIPADDQWHSVNIDLGIDAVTASVDGETSEFSFTKPSGDRILLLVKNGKAEFDDILFRVHRETGDSLYTGFDMRETAWLRKGGTWVDHGGIACIPASNWISLIAPAGEGLLVSRSSFGPDTALAVTVSENTQWYGWKQKPQHTHFPFDNIRLYIGPGNSIQDGYLLELNSEERTYTVLSRKGQEVKRIRQDKDFPIKFKGGHSPYSPRINRIILKKQGNTVSASVNGIPILEFQDDNPPACGYTGFGGHDTRINFSNIEVVRLKSSAEGPHADDDRN